MFLKNRTRLLNSPIAVFLILYLLAVLCVIQSCGDKTTENVNPVDSLFFWPEINQTEIDMDPAWSPNGTKIIYFRDFNKNYLNDDTQWVWGVFLHDVGTGADSLLWDSVWASDFDWSPDGKRITYRLNGQVYISDLARNTVQAIPSTTGGHNPRWSPCGDRIIYFVRVGSNNGMYVYDTLHSTQYLQLPYATHGTWLSDCDSIAVISRIATWQGEMLIHSLSTNASSSTPFLETYKRGIAASPDGSSILVVRDGNASTSGGIWSYCREDRLYVQIATKGGAHLDWSPDGQWIVYTNTDSLDGHLWLMRPDGSDKHQITF